jgi:hypothetical protein
MAAEVGSAYRAASRMASEHDGIRALRIIVLSHVAMANF